VLLISRFYYVALCGNEKVSKAVPALFIDISDQIVFFVGKFLFMLRFLVVPIMKSNLSVIVLGLRGFPGVQGGVETHAQHIYPILAQLGCRIEVVVRTRYQNKSYGSAWRDVHFKPVFAPGLRSIEAMVHTFIGVLYAAVKRPDVLHIHGIGPGLMVPLARLLGLRVVITHHGADYERQKWGMLGKTVLKLGEYFGVRFANECIVISDVIKTLVREKHGRDSLLIPNGVHLPVIPQTADALKQFGLRKGHYVLFVGRMVPEKRHSDLIEAFSRASIKGWKLVLVGASDHPDSYSAAIIKHAQKSNNIVCAGFQSGVALAELYAHAGVFVLPSSHEGLPIALLEALSFGLPVIASDIPANVEVKCSNITYFPLGDIRVLEKLLQTRAMSSVTLAQVAEVRKNVAKKYCWNTIAAQTRAAYIRISSSRPKNH
jgi:glycosyltransferase involved in cell wall biosynthesis